MSDRSAAGSMAFDVAVVGYGPTGATLANLLGRAGLSVLVLDREPAISQLPRAIHCDGEVMRVFQSLALPTRLESISRPGYSSVFVNSEGETLMVRSTSGGPNSYYFHQPELEAILREGVARHANVDVRLSHEVISVDAQPAGGATLVVNDLASNRTLSFHARYVIGCDGGRSMVRRTLGGEVIDLGLHQPWLVFDVILREDIPALPLHTVQHCDPRRPMTYCNVIGSRRRWEIMLMPGDDPAELMKPENLWGLVSRWVRPEQADIERAATYTFHSIIARGWRRGPLMIAGDAAHQTPPFLGQGMCAGIRDAVNLSWKLSAVLKGGADDSLLDSYETERLPHVHHLIDLAVHMGNIIQTTDPEQVRERDARMRAQPEVVDPPSPRLGPGAWRDDLPKAGHAFPPLALDDAGSVMVEAHVGSGFTVLVQPGWMEAQAAPCAGVHVLTASGPAARWLDEQGVIAVALRPDRYIFGSARDKLQLQSLVEALRPLAEAVSRASDAAKAAPQGVADVRTPLPA